MYTMRQVVEQEPIPPRSLNPAVDRDLDTICLKCLQKKPERRYGSAKELGDDLQRFLDRRPIAARPVGSLEKGFRWCRRNPALAAASFVVMIVIASAFALVSASYYRAEDALKEEAFQRKEAEQKEQAERRERYRSNLIAAGSAMRLHNVSAARDALEAAPAELRGWEWKHYFHQLDVSTDVNPGIGTVGVSFASPNRRFLIGMSGTERRIGIFDLEDGGKHHSIPSQQVGLMVRFSPDNRWLAFNRKDFNIELWDVREQRPHATLSGHTARVAWIGWAPDGQRFVSTSEDKTIRIWDVAARTHKVLLRPEAHYHDRVEYTADGKRLITIEADTNRTYMWDATSGAKLAEYRGIANSTQNIHHSPKGDSVAIVEDFPSNRIHVLDALTLKPRAVFAGHTNQIHDLKFSPDGERFASASLDQSIRLWSVREGRQIAKLDGHVDWVTSIDFSLDGRRLASASQDQTVRLWDAGTGAALAVMHGHTSQVHHVMYLADGRTLAAAALDGSLRWFDSETAASNGAIRGHASFVYGVAFHPDGERAASASWDGTVRVWQVTSGKELAKFAHGGDNTIVTSVAFHPGGRYLASLCRQASLPQSSCRDATASAAIASLTMRREREVANHKSVSWSRAARGSRVSVKRFDERGFLQSG